MIYLDSAATTLQKPREVEKAVSQAMRNYASPGRGGHRAAMLAAEAVYRCRVEAAELFDAEPEQITFTMNATHGLNIAIKSLVNPGDRVVVSGFEHNAVMRPLHHIGADVAVAGRKLFDPKDTLLAFERLVDARTAAVICTHVSNVFGYILPVEEIAALCGRRGVPFVLDASQSAGILPVSMRRLGAAFIAMPGHKGLYGPQGTGVLICGTKPKTLLEGGSGSMSLLPDMPEELPDRLEAGTQNVAGIHGLGAGIRFVRDTGITCIAQHERELRRELTQILSDTGLDAYSSDTCQTGVLSIRTKLDSERAAQTLAEAGIAVRAGLHCAPLAHESAGSLEHGTVRFSFSAFNTHLELRTVGKVLKKSFGA